MAHGSGPLELDGMSPTRKSGALLLSQMQQRWSDHPSHQTVAKSRKASSSASRPQPAGAAAPREETWEQRALAMQQRVCKYRKLEVAAGRGQGRQSPGSPGMRALSRSSGLTSAESLEPSVPEEGLPAQQVPGPLEGLLLGLGVRTH